MFNIFKRKEKVILKTTDMDNDLKFLLFVIQTNINNFKMSIELNKTLLVLEDSFILNATNEILTETINTLSEEYLELLYKYFDRENFLPFISTLVTKEMIEIGITKNRKNINSK